MGKKKAAAYLRRSSDRQEKSIPDQRKDILKYADGNGFDVIAEFVDDAISGTVTDDREAFRNLMRTATERGCDWEYVLVFDIKRFGRIDNDEAGYWRYMLRQVGVQIVYISENFNGDDTDDLIRPVKQWQARQESKDLAKVTIRGLLSLFEGGWWMGGVPPYGFDLMYYDSTGQPYQILRFMEDGSKQILDPKGKLMRTLPKGEKLIRSKKDLAKLVPSHPARVAILVRIFALYLKGLGFRSIADLLNKEGVPAPRNADWGSLHDGRWSHTTIAQIIKNRLFCGDNVWNRRTLAKFFKISNGQAQARPSVRMAQSQDNDEADWMIKPNTHQGLISRETFERAKEMRKVRQHNGSKNSFRRGRAKLSNYLLSALLKCKLCGHSLQGHTVSSAKTRKNGEKIKSYYYLCSSYVSKGTSVCKRALFRKDGLESWVLGEVGSRLMEFLRNDGRDVLRKAIEKTLKKKEKPSSPDDLKKVKAQLLELQKKADRFLEMLTPVNKEFIDEKLLRLKSEREALRTRLSQLEATAKPAMPDAAALAAEIVKGLGDFDQIVKRGTPEEKKQLLGQLIEGIDVDPDSRTGEMRIKEFPSPAFASDGNSSFSMVAGARFVLAVRPR